MTIRTLDLFCGGGGSSWGAKLAGAKIICGVDSWLTATTTFKRNFPRARAVNLTVSETSCPDDLGDIGRIDLILASPECTNHTHARGARPRDEASRRTAGYVLNFACELKPRWVVLENVVQMRMWDGYDPLVAGLEALGYGVRNQVIDAADFGVPQARRRLFVLCERRGVVPPEIQVLSPTTGTVRDILDPDGTWQTRPLRTIQRSPNTLERAERAMAELGRRRPFLVVYYGSDGAGGWQSLDRPIRTLTTLDRFGLVTWRGATPMFRMLQVPELQRAMGFSADYRLDQGTRRDRIKLLGNGVCPPVMQAIVSSLAGVRAEPFRRAA